MADLALSIAGTLLEKLGSEAFKKISSAGGMKDDLKKLEETTTMLEAMLLDAETKQEGDKPLRLWLARLKDAFQDAQDVLDEFECEVLRIQVVREYGSLGRKVCRFFSRSNPLAFRFSIAHQIKNVREKLDEIASEMHKFQLIRIQPSQEQRYLMQGTREMTHSFVDASEVIGRELDEEQILDMVMEHDHNVDNNIPVVSIVGFGGLGKTTLAKSVFNDDKVVDKFPLRIWVCVSQDFNVTRLVREIIKSATKANDDIGDLSLELLQTSLRDTLKDKKFLLVLDDVWNEDPTKWHELKELLTVGSKESKIIVTTRSTSVALIMGSTTRLYQLEGLSEADSLSLFFKFASGDQKQAEQSPTLKDIGKEIVKKCRGVPLALKTLGSLLRLKTEAQWKFVRDNKIWQSEQELNGHILPALQLSYNAMPPSLKQCFAYCSTFKEDSVMNSFELIRIWMALGILQSSNNKMELEDVGESHFKELCARSFFQVDDIGEEKIFNDDVLFVFKVHDLIHNLACSITQGECSAVNSDDQEISDSVRYLRILLNDENNLKILQKLRKVRSIHVDCTGDNQKDEIVQLFLSTCISKFKHLRVFDLQGLSFKQLPSSIGTLKHLRYLNLKDNERIKKLPDSICKLQSLQTLCLAGCEELEELPKDIHNLISLRTLTVTTKQTLLPADGVGRLKSIRFFAIGGCKNLRALPHDLISCPTLRTLAVICCEQLDLASGVINKVDQLTLQTITIENLPETTDLPQWLQQAAKTLKNLHIEDCPKLDTLPEWLPKLTSLEKLAIKDCPDLSSLPDGMDRLTSLSHLLINDCDTLVERCRREVGQDWPKIARLPNLYIGTNLCTTQTDK